MPFSSLALQLQVTFVLCYCWPCAWELFVSRQNRRMPNLTVGHGSKDCLLSEIPEEGKLIVSGASVACIVSHHYPWFWQHAGIIRRLLVLPDTSTSSTFSWICKASLVLSPLKTCNNNVLQCFGVFWTIRHCFQDWYLGNLWLFCFIWRQVSLQARSPSFQWQHWSHIRYGYWKWLALRDRMVVFARLS